MLSLKQKIKYIYNNSHWYGSTAELNSYGKMETLPLTWSAICINIVAIAIPFFLIGVLDNYLIEKETKYLPLLLGWILTAGIILFFLNKYQTNLILWSGSVFKHNITCNLFSRLLRVNQNEIAKTVPILNLKIFGSVQQIEKIYNGEIITNFVNLCFVPVILGLIFLCGGFKLGILSLISIIIFISISLFLIGNVNYSFNNYNKVRAYYNHTVNEILSKFFFIKSHGFEFMALKQYNTANEGFVKTIYNFMSYRGKLRSFYLAYQKLFLTLFTTFALIAFSQNQINIFNFILIFLFASYLLYPILNILKFIRRLDFYVEEKERIDNIFDMSNNYIYEVESFIPKLGDVNFNNVSFSYDKGRNIALNNVSLSLTVGESIAIVQSNELSKSAFKNILIGKAMPLGGQALVDGIDIFKLGHNNMMNHLGILDNNPIIFKGTIIENMTMFGTLHSHKIFNLCKEFKVDELFSKLPKGYHTLLYDKKCDAIPMHIKQIIAFIRVFAYSPKLILYDNAESGLDKEYYNILFNILLKLKPNISMILLSSDRNFLRLVDREYQICDKGILKELVFNEAGTESMQENLRDSRKYGFNAFEELIL